MRLFLLLCLVLANGFAFADEAGAIRAFNKARASEPQLIAFLRPMPKGGDLHNHMIGAIYSDYVLDYQTSRRNRYFDPATNAFTDDSTKMPATALLTNNALLYRWLNSVSMRGWSGAGVSTGNDHFFDAFGNVVAAAEGMSSAQQLKEVIGRALWQNTHYMELMTSVAADADVTECVANPPASDDLESALRVMKPRLEKLLVGAWKYLAARDAEVTRLLGLPVSIHDPANKITVRYVYAIDRTISNDEFFAQAAMGLYLAAHEPHVVAINMRAPEEHPNARRNFDRQMRIIDFLWKQFGKPNVTLHAAEMTLAISPVEALRDRIWKTVQLGHAKRIGHGVEVAWSDDVDGLLKMMKRDGIAVEICLSSNASIMGVTGDRHPLKMYRDAGVPTFLNTDDEGISRSNFTYEMVRGVRDQKLGYLDLKEMARNSLEYSFLTGKSLFVGRNYKKLLPEFSGVRSIGWKPSALASKLIAENPKLAVQVRLERSFVGFEGRFGKNG